jgi:hypothetical protein
MKSSYENVFTLAASILYEVTGISNSSNSSGLAMGRGSSEVRCLSC